MILQCENCNQYFKVTDLDSTRIINAQKENKKFLVLFCQKCFNHTSWKPENEIFSDEKLLEKEITNIDKFETVNDLGIKNDIESFLPKEYYQYLVENKELEIRISKDRDNFNLFSLDELFTNVSIDNEEYLTIFQLKGYFKTLKEVELFENSLAIGYENGDILFIDEREENSKLYIFYPDGGDIEKTKYTLNNIVNR